MAQEPNSQKIYPIDSEVYAAVKARYISQGLALPSTAGPWSGDELLRMLDRLDTAAFTPGEQAAWDYALGKLGFGFAETKAGTQPDFRFSGSVNLEMSAHTNTDDFIGADDFILPWNRHRPLAALDMEAWVTGHGYGFFELPVGNNFPNTMYQGDGKLILGSTLYGKAPFTTNIIMLPPAGGADFDLNFPFRAFISAGGGAVDGSGWSLEIGRERLSWGPGESGNFLVGSQVDYHNSIRTTFYNDTFKWT
ncbi:MAG: hypothetical protein LBT11_07775, partial [Treponema sp.]|nr:hypothetical protein [Treponema sp.]